MTVSSVWVAAGEAHAQREGDPALAERALESLGQRGVLGGDEVGERLDDGDVGAERAPDARELDPDDAAAEDDDPGGDLVEFERLLAREDAAADVQPRQRPAVRAGREDDIRPDVAVVADPHGQAGLECSLAGDRGDPAGLDEPFEATELLRDDALTVGAQACRVDRLERGADADGCRGAGGLGHFGGVQQRLGGDAAAMQARPADLLLLDQRDALAELRGAQRSRVAAAAAAEHDEIETVIDHQTASPSVKRISDRTVARGRTLVGEAERTALVHADSGDVQMHPGNARRVRVGGGAADEVPQEQAGEQRSAGGIADLRVGEVGDGGVEVVDHVRGQRQLPGELAHGARSLEVGRDGRVVAHDPGRAGAQRDRDGSGERGDIHDDIGMLTTGRHQPVGEHQSTLGIRVEDFDGRAVELPEHVARPGRTTGRHVVGDAQPRRDPDGKSALGDRAQHRQGRRRPAHVVLHADHRGRRLEREPPGVEGDALPDQRHVALRAGRCVVQADQTRGPVGSLTDTQDAAVPAGGERHPRRAPRPRRGDRRPPRRRAPRSPPVRAIPPGSRRDP